MIVLPPSRIQRRTAPWLLQNEKATDATHRTCNAIVGKPIVNRLGASSGGTYPSNVLPTADPSPNTVEADDPSSK